MLLSVSGGGDSLGDRVPQKKKRERKAGIELDFSPNSFLFPLRLFPGSPPPPQEARLFFLRSSSPINCSRRCHTAPVSRPTHPPPPSASLFYFPLLFSIPGLKSRSSAHSSPPFPPICRHQAISSSFSSFLCPSFGPISSSVCPFQLFFLPSVHKGIDALLRNARHARGKTRKENC